LQIEARVMGELVNSVILPAAVDYQSKLINNVQGLKSIGLDETSYEAQLGIIRELSEHINFIKRNVDEMVEARKRANKIDDILERSIAYDEEVKTFFEPIREHVDKLEQLVDDSQWPLPKFRELLFIK